PLFVTVLIVSITYAIVQHNLFDVRLIATELFSVLTIFIFLINIFTSSTSSEFIFNTGLFILIAIFGYLLVRGTIREIEALQELSDKKSEFLSIASHQLRTPISSMKGYLAMLREGDFGKLNKEQLLTINKTYKINEGMLRLINDFLNLSRAEKGTLEYSFDKVDLIKMMDGIVEHLRVWADVKNVDINWKKPEEPIMVYADEGKLSQVISNLIDNAIKYTQTKGGVSVKAAKENGHVRIYIKDNGIGIPKEELNTIFQSFERGEKGKRENAGGSGLGLYVAKMIIEGHNGRIWAESEGEGKGSTFVVELPLTPLENITQKKDAEDIYQTNNRKK
ncbi:MAG: HAMP domain-containing sensor histidine kinase, partial [Candidatus Spechtbacterales bacterium]|nr:HAMP domain-containing sensor histidine kinase [Candidatus Spechtbacterales bacterium]